MTALIKHNFIKFIAGAVFVAALCAAVFIAALCAAGRNALPGARRPADPGYAADQEMAAPNKRDLFLLDTFITITVYSDDADAMAAALDAAEAVFERVDRLADRFDADSDIYRINHAAPGAGAVKVGAETLSLIKTAIGYCEQSGGAFDIGLGAVSDLWGFDGGAGAVYGVADGAVESTVYGAADGANPAASGENAADGAAPAASGKSVAGAADGAAGAADACPPALLYPERLAAALAAGGYKKIKVDDAASTVSVPPGLHIDLGSIAKGYAAQAAADAVRGAGIKNALINAGGNICAVGENPAAGYAGGESWLRPWRIGILHPRLTDGAKLLAAVTVTDKAVVTSGDYERYVEYGGRRYCHILDPATGAPADACVSATVICSDSALADYLSTALFVLGPEKGFALLEKYPGADAVIVTRDMEIFINPGFATEIEFLRFT